MTGLKCQSFLPWRSLALQSTTKPLYSKAIITTGSKALGTPKLNIFVRITSFYARMLSDHFEKQSSTFGQ